MQSLASNSIVKDFDQLVIRLERNHKWVLRLARKLNSYKYEPRNYECFIRLRDLRSGFNELAQDQMVLFDEIQHRNLIFENAEKKIDTLLHRFHQLENDMASYILEAKNC